MMVVTTITDTDGQTLREEGEGKIRMMCRWIEPCVAQKWVAQWHPWHQAIAVVGEEETEKDEEEEEWAKNNNEKRGGTKNISTNSYIVPTSTITPPIGNLPMCVHGTQPVEDCHRCCVGEEAVKKSYKSICT